MKTAIFFLSLGIFCCSSSCEADSASLYPQSAITFSQDFLLAVKTEQPYAAFRDTLAQIDLKQLNEELSTPEKKLAFWINTYNSLVKAKLSDDMSAFEDRNAFFFTKDQKIGGVMISLDDIESGLLRRQYRKTNQSFFKSFRVDTLEPRIHFTLNCGATSCPPIAYYDPEHLNEDLAAAEQSFVSQSTRYDATTETVTISELFKWFETDFGGKEEIIHLLQDLNLVPLDVSPQIEYSPYDWNLDLDNE